MVHVIPMSVGQRRRDAGDAANPRDASAATQAAPPLDPEWQAVADHYVRRVAQQQDFDTEIAARRLNGEIAKAETDAVANAPADGAGLHDGMYGQVDPRNGQVVKTGQFDTLFDTFLNQAPAELRPGLASRKEALRAAGAVRMAQMQLQRRKDYEQGEVDTALKTGAIGIGNADPDDHTTFEAARQEGLDLINKMGVDSAIRQQLAQDWFSTAAKSRFEALIAKDPKRALAIFGAGAPAAGSETAGDTAQTPGSLLSGSSNITFGKDDRVGTQTPDERIAKAFRDDLPRQEQEALARKATVAKLALETQIRAAIDHAEAEAPDATSRAGSYSGSIPGEDAYKIIFGHDEGIRRRQALDWQINVRKKIFAMGAMPNQAIHAALRDANSGPKSSPEDQSRSEATAVAAKLVLKRRRVDPGGYVSELSPEISTGWKAVLGNGPSDPAAFDQDTYHKTIRLSVAQQKALGIDDENLQPVPFSILLKLAEDRDSGDMHLMDNYAKASELFARTKGAVARAALVRELDDAGLSGILPGGKPHLSVGEVFQADAKALGKVATNAGIALANVNDWVAYGMSGGTISPPDYKDAYYEPENNVEKVMMRQGSDALGWAIPGPGVGRAAESAIPRAIEAVGSGAARTERSIGNPKAANISTPKVTPGQVEKPGFGEGATGAIPAKPQPENLFNQPTTSVDNPGELPIVDSALTGVTTLSSSPGGRQTTRPIRKSKLDRDMLVAVASEIFARDPSRVEHPGAKFGKATTNNYRRAYAEANPDVNIKDLIIHHSAEQQLLKRLLGFLSRQKINSVENLRGIPKDIDKILHLMIIRSENDKFYDMYPRPTEQQILDHSTMMDKKYGHHFVPPVGKYR
jgi:hypothetical protein